MPSNAPTHAPAIKVAGTGLAAMWLATLTSVRIERSLGMIGRTVLRFVDHDFSLSGSRVFALGAEVALDEFASGRALFRGEVTGVALEQDAQHSPELVVTVDDYACRLTRNTTSQTFLNQSYSGVVEKVAKQNGFGTNVSMKGGTEYLLQTGTDLAFIDELTRRSGTVWWMDPQDGRPTLHVAPAGTSSDTVPVKLGDLGDLLRFSVRASGRNPDKVVVTGWDVKAQAKVVGMSRPGNSHESAFVAKFPGRTSSQKNSMVVADQAPLTLAEAESMADSLFQEVRAGAVVARGSTTINGRIAPGTSVQVENAGPASGTYLVTSVEHIYDRRGFHTSFTAGPHRPAGLVDVLGSPTSDPGFSMDGVVAAIVTNVTDEDNTQGRVKVQYTTPNGDLESPWARLVSLGAGAKRGMVFQPEVGDEVLVAFERGDTRRPVVLGGLFSATKGLPTTDNVDQNKVTYRRITSRLGHLIELADGAGDDAQHVLLKVGTAEHRIRLGKDRLDIEVANKPVKVTNQAATVELSDRGDVTIEGNNITLKATGNISLEAGQKLTAKGGTGASLAGLTVEVKADTQGTVQAGGPLAVKGATVAIN